MTTAKWTSNNTGAQLSFSWGCLQVCGGGDALISSIVIDTCYENLIDGSHWDENGLNENLKGYENLKRNEKKSE